MQSLFGLVWFDDMKNRGRRYFCVEGIKSIPKHPKRDNVTLDLHPTRVTSKGQKHHDKIMSSGAGDKVMNEIKKKLAAYNKEEELGLLMFFELLIIAF